LHEAPLTRQRLRCAKFHWRSCQWQAYKEFAMNWDIVEGNWKQFKGKVKAQWGNLTDDQLDVIAGKRVELSGKIQEAYGLTTDEVEKQIKEFEKANLN
jgi:uncharacterized protein YjbJ (UPF0337 family)